MRSLDELFTEQLFTQPKYLAIDWGLFVAIWQADTLDNSLEKKYFGDH